MKFVDRIEETKRLRSLLAQKDGAFACLYGRRRIGKSRLLREVIAGRKDAILHIADKSDAVLQRTRLAQDIGKLIPGFGSVSYPDWGTLLDRWLKDAPRGSLFILDEFPYLVERSPELPSILQRILEDIKPTGIKCIVCGSSQRMMQGLVLDEREPLYGRASEIINLRPIGFDWMKTVFPALSPRDRLEHYAVWGGVPRYWELSENESNLWQTIRQQVFSPLGLLRNEPAYLLLDDLKDSVRSSSILSIIGMGTNRMSEIASRLQVPTTALGGPLKKLTDLGLVYKETPFGCDAKSNKRSLYRIADPFLDFWYRFVLPNYSDERYLEDPNDFADFKKSFSVHLGHVWEKLIQDILPLRKIPGISKRLRKPARWWGNGTNGKAMEIDIVAETIDAKTLLVGEAKLSLSAREAEHALSELKVKASLLPFSTEYDKVVCQLFAADTPPTSALGLDWAENN